VGVIDAYVDELGTTLRGAHRVKTDLLTEARDSLHDAAAAYEEVGLSRPAAERRAVADFGAVGEIAPDYQTELAVAQSRRTALSLFFVIGVQGLLWQRWWPWFAEYPDPANANAHASGTNVLYAVLDGTVEWLGIATIVVAALAVIALGVGSRYVETDGHRVLVRRIAAGVLAFCALFALIGVAMCLSHPVQATVPGLLWTTLFLLLPLTVVAGSARRCLALV
jgi:hypothetical protein